MFEKELPAGYREVEHVCFGSVRTTFLSDFLTLVPGLIMAAVGCVLVRLTLLHVVFSVLIFAACIYPYFALHEIIHGLVFMVMTRQKVKMAFTKGGAYCAMPDVFVYRKAALAGTAAPWIVFSVLFAVLGATFMLLGHWLVLPVCLLLSFHLFGCRSDRNLLKIIRKCKDKNLLVRDNGTEQWLYLPQDKMIY